MRLNKENLTDWLCGAFLVVATVWMTLNIIEYVRWVLSGSP